MNLELTTSAFLLLTMSSHLVVWHRWVIALARKVVLVLHRLLSRHLATSTHVTATIWKAVLWRESTALDLCVRVVIGGVDLVVVVDAVLVAAAWLWRVQACL
jgi:hypothetical protein